MASGAIKKFAGSFLGTGADLDIKTPGFRPKHVFVENVAAGGLVRLEWTEHMADASACKTAANGAKTFITTLGITPLASGFRIGADTDANVAAELCHFVATE